ncbi:MAG: hypothetical protein NTW07_10375, partial [candidate division Zixibacteria bacterium]|nr:hypothetical protein [candidate division Zixibacteria bacterium]
MAGIDTYLYAMTDLEQDYSNITFVYMTGHLDGTGDAGNLNARNNQIRSYCIAHEKTLFDFADIETYDPDGTRYPSASDACEWCYDWCASHACPACADCAHSHCFNCYQKGKAFWWMMARVSGWTGEVQVYCEGRVGNANGLGTYPNEVTISDVQTLITAKFIVGKCDGIIACLAEAHVNQSGGANPTCKDISIGDVQTLVNHLF